LALANSAKKNNKEKFKNLSNIYNIINDYSKGYLTQDFNSNEKQYFSQIFSFLYTAAERPNNKGEHKEFKKFYDENSLDTIENAIFNLTETLRTTKVSVDTNKMLKRNFFNDKKKQDKLRILEAKIDEYSKIPMFVSNQDEKKDLGIKIEKSKKEIEDLKNELELGKLLKGDSFIYQNINIKQIQNSLKDKEVILYYIDYADHMYYGLVTKKDFKFFQKEYKNNEITDTVKKLRLSINYSNNSLSKFDFEAIQFKG
jgi:hypothetical protein